MSQRTSNVKGKWIIKGIFAFAVIILIAGQWYFNTSQKSDNEKTVERAHLIGQKLILDGFKRKLFSETPSKRTLASDAEFRIEVTEEGQTGRDSWGYPFSYKKVNKKLLIWSMGPNHKLDTPESQIHQEQSQGDDLLVAIRM